MSSEFEDLQRDGKLLAAEGRLFESLKKFEKARKLKETPKILHRIQKLKDFIAKNNYMENTSHVSEDEYEHSVDQNAEPRDTGECPLSEGEKLATNKETMKVLNQIQNIEGNQKLPFERQFYSANLKDLKKTEQPKPHIPESPSDLSSEDLKTFSKLKKRAMELSYDGNFKDSMETFSKALQLCACPKVKKHYEDIKLMASQHAEKLNEVQNLTNTGKKLATVGNQAESLKKLRDAFAVCPSPSISKMIKQLESQTLSKSSPEKDPIPFKLSENSSTSKTETLSTGSDNSGKDSSICNDPSALSPEKLAKYKSLYEKARVDAGEGKLQEALKSLLKAKSICPSNKILKRITALEEHIKNTAVGDGEDDKMVAVADGFYVFHEIYEKLYPYQRQGVAWMWELFKKRKGGILGDDMGLGKTFQVIAFLSGLIDADKLKHVIIIMPVSLIPNWEREFKKWCPGISVNVFHGGTKVQRERSILRVQRRGHVLLTSYGMVVNNLDCLTQFNERDFVWDYVILDEGHKIKNPTKTTKAVHGIPSKNRLVLTGTPIQNNLAELWALYDFAHQGTLLGSMKTFKMTYEASITRAREKDATAGEKRLGTEMADNLKKLISPYFLRRTKAEVWGNKNPSSNITNLEDELQNLCIQENKLGRKNDLIMWVYLSEPQCEIYRNFLHSEAVKTILVSKRSPLVELTVLKKICDHPRLLSHRACLQLGLNGELSEEDLTKELEDESSYSSSIENVSDETLIAESGKMKFLMNLLENLKANGHRTLVFSLSRKILDMVHRILQNRNWKIMRIDGTISKIEERERRIQLFQKDPSYSVFLLTTQVGGVGITLTAADRVIIYDPSWNPATDAQAVDRVYRIGQQKDVVVYRLITCGSVEEKIYRRQVFKDSITRQATGATDPYRYFSKQELRELFCLDDPHHSGTQVQLSEMHSDGRQSDTRLDEHIAFLHSLNIFGISDHDLMFSKSAVDHSEDNDEGAVSQDFIKKQVLMAQARIEDEAAVVEEGIRLAGAYSRPYAEPIKTFKSYPNKDTYIPPTFPEVLKVGNEVSPTPSANRESSLSNRNLESLSLKIPQSLEKTFNTKHDSSISEKERITYHFSKSAATSEENSCSLFMNSETDSSVDPKAQKSSVRKSLKVLNKEDSQTNVDVIDIYSDKSSGDEDEMKSTEKEYSSEAEHLNGTFNSGDHSSAQMEHSVVPSSKKDDISSPCVQSEDTIDISNEESFSKEFVSNQTDHSIEAMSPDTSIQPDLNESAQVEEILSQKLDSVGDVVTNEPMSEPGDLNISYTSDSEVLKANQKHGDSNLAQSTRVSINSFEEENFNTEENSANIECNNELEPDILSISNHTPTAKTNSEDLEYRTSNTVDNSLDSTEEDVFPENSLKPASPDKSLLQNIFESSTPVLCRNNSGFKKDSSYRNINILEDISFDEKPMLKKNSRKSCAKWQEFACESDSSYKTSCPSSVNNSDDEAVPESDIGNATADRSDILDTSTIVPSSIPNSPFASNSTVHLNRSLPMSKRITPLRLRKSFVLPTGSPFAIAVARSPIYELESFQQVDVSQNSAMDSTSEVDSPIVKQRKKKNIIVSDSEDDYEEEKSCASGEDF